MATVKFYTLLRLKLGISEVEIESDNITLKDLIYLTKDAIDNDLVVKKVLDDDGNLLRGINILVNGHNILTLDKENTIINNDDVVGLFPMGGGG